MSAAPETTVRLRAVAVDESGQHYLPASTLPEICVEHGLSATNTATTWIRPPRKITDDLSKGVSSYIPGGIGPFWKGVSNSFNRLQHGPAVRAEWPLCIRCESRRSRGLRSASALAALGTALIILAVVIAVADLEGLIVSAMFVIGLLALPASVALLHTIRPERLFHATAAPDGSAVIVTDPHPDFAAAVGAGQG